MEVVVAVLIFLIPNIITFLVVQRKWHNDEIGFFWWVIGFLGTFLGWLVSRSRPIVEQISWSMSAKKGYRREKREIKKRLKLRDERISYLVNSPVTHQIVNWIKSLGEIQNIRIKTDEISVTSSYGSSNFNFYQKGIADLPWPEYYEYTNYIDEPYLLAVALNAHLGNQFSISYCTDVENHWDGAGMKKQEKPRAQKDLKTF